MQLGLGIGVTRGGKGISIPPLPTVTSLDVTTGIGTGGTAITITGTNFTGATSVTFGGNLATGVTVVNSTTITCTTPAFNVDNVNSTLVAVAVTTPSGTGSLSNAYTFTNPVTSIITFSPSSVSGSVATPVTITGVGFNSLSLGSVTVNMNGNLGSGYAIVNDTTLTFNTSALVGAIGSIQVILSYTGGGRRNSMTFT